MIVSGFLIFGFKLNDDHQIYKLDFLSLQIVELSKSYRICLIFNVSNFNIFIFNL